ncbi:MAG: hypothetical protein M1511_15850 [Deltaproteobacteria bacterium]|nr:hypothetical protein [Deltaproteobacteria bacterium]
MQQLEMNLEVIIKEDLGQYIKRTMPTFLADVANSICHDIHRNLEDPETLFYLGNGYILARSVRSKVRGCQGKVDFGFNRKSKGYDCLVRSTMKSE